MLYEFKITESTMRRERGWSDFTTPSDGLGSYHRYLLDTEEMQSTNSTAPADWAGRRGAGVIIMVAEPWEV